MVAWIENLDEFAILIKRKRIFEVSLSTLYGCINNEETGTANIILQASKNSETFSYRKIVCKINTVPDAGSPIISKVDASVNEIRCFLKARLPEIIFMREDIDESSVESDDNFHTHESSLHCTECDDEIETCNNCGKDYDLLPALKGWRFSRQPLASLGAGFHGFFRKNPPAMSAALGF